MEATTAALVRYLTELQHLVGPADQAAARTLTLDFLGVAVAGSQTREGRSILRTANRLGRAGPCSVPASQDLFDPPTAALITGTSGYSIGLTDTHSQSITHPGPSVVPAAVAVGQAVGAPGDAVLRAVVLGCEAIVRIGSVVNPSHRARGFHPTATCNVFGAAVSAGYLLGLTEVQMRWALGLAGSMSGGLYEFRREGSMLMALHGGWPASSGITAAYLAAEGYTGPSTVLEGPEGFFAAFADHTRPELLTSSTDRPGVHEVSLRPYNACRYAHAGIDALQHLASTVGPLDPAQVEHVTVATHRTAVEQETEPSTVVGARLSTRFTIALTLVRGPQLADIDADDLADEQIRALTGRIEVVEDPALTALFPTQWACRVTLRTRDGQTLEHQVDTPKGEPGNPMLPAEVSRKYHRLTEPVLGADGATALEEAVADLPDALDVTTVSDALVGGAGSLASPRTGTPASLVEAKGGTQ